jgi:hypothetical protein
MPSTVFDVGDPINARLSLGVVPDGTTMVTVAVTRPDGTAIAPPTVIGPVNVMEYTAQFTASMAGDWLVVWTVVGTGQGVQAKVFNVRALPSSSNTRPVWAPFLSDVGDFVPHKTRDLTGGVDLILGTFTGATTPTDEQAHRILDGAITMVAGVTDLAGTAVGQLSPALYPLARRAAAIRAAADIELAFPERTTDMSVYSALNARALAELASLQAAATHTGTGPVEATPVWDFPDPPNWADDNQMLL